MTELRRHERWASVFFTLKDPADGSCVGVTMPRGQFDGLRLELGDGERVHVYGRPELYEQRGDFRLRALTIERFGVGAHLAALERLKTKLAAEGLFAAERKRPLPLLPRRIGLVTGNDAAAKRDVLTTIQSRFPAANVLVAETYVQGPRAALEIVAALERALRAAGRRRDRPHARRRQLRGPAAVQRRARSSAPSQPAACRSCRPSGTSRTRRSATSPPTFARRRRRWRASSSSPSSLSCRAGSTARASRSRAASRARSSATRSARAFASNGCGQRPRVALERESRRVERAHERLRRAPALAVERKRAALESIAGKLVCCPR